MTTLALLLATYVAALLDSTFVTRWQVGSVGPDLFALVAFVWLAGTQSRWAVLVAAAIGLASDLNSPAPLGIGMGAFAVCACAAVYLRQNLRLDGPIARLGIVWFGAAGTCLLQAIVLRIMGQIALSPGAMAQHASLVGLYNTLLAVPALMVASWTKTVGPAARYFSSGA